MRDHDLSYRGDFPCNTHGGQLGMGQTGLSGGMSHVLEGVRQIQGRAGDRQLARHETAYVSGTGGVMSEQGAVVLLGALIVALVIAAQSALPELRRSAAHRRRAYHVGDALAHNGAPTPLVTGVRLALDPGRGEAAVPVRSTLLGVGLAVAALVATLVYASGLSYFTSTPRLYGWVWSYQVEPTTNSITDLQHAVAQDRDVRAAWHDPTFRT